MKEFNRLVEHAYIKMNEYTNDDTIKYVKVLFGGSIGNNAPRSIRELKNTSFETDYPNQIYDTKPEAKDAAKESNAGLSKGDKQYYGMKWKVAEVVMNSETDGIYTGK